MKEQQGGGGLATGQTSEIMYKGGVPLLGPTRATGSRGEGAVGGAAPFGVSLSDPLLRVPWKAGEEPGGIP